jgi:hypothetical protein
MFQIYKHDSGTFLAIHTLLALPGYAIYSSGSPLAFPFRLFVDYTIVWLLAAAVTMILGAQIYRSGEVSITSLLHDLGERLPDFCKAAVVGLALLPLWVVVDIYITAARYPLWLLFVLPGLFAILYILAPWSLFVPTLIIGERASLRGAFAQSRALVAGTRVLTAVELLVILSLWSFLPMVLYRLLSTLVDGVFGPGAFTSLPAGAYSWRTALTVPSAPLLGLGLMLLYFARVRCAQDASSDTGDRSWTRSPPRNRNA